MREEGCHKRGSVSPTNLTGGSFLPLDEVNENSLVYLLF